VPKGKSLAMQKYSKKSKTARLDLREVCISLLEFHAKTTNNMSKKQSTKIPLLLHSKSS
jgi:hypothetical protein